MTARNLAGLVLALGLLLTACGGGGDNQALIDALVDEGATTEEAECFIDALGPDNAQIFVDNIDADEPPEGLDVEAVLNAVTECGIEG